MSAPAAARGENPLPPQLTERLNFANQLRGIAALLVAISHLVGVFWAMRVYVAAATFSPVQPGPLPAAYGLISYQWLEFGPFGVALFFLISGLVVPFSLQHHTRWSFLLARLLRIYPTFILATLLEMLLLYGASRYWHIPFAYNARTIIAECLLVSNLTGYPVIDFVSWTLAIEVKFYLLIMLARPAIRQGRLSVLLGIAVAIAILDAVVSRYAGRGGAALAPLLYSFGMETPFIVFMLIGVLFHFYHVGLCGRRAFAASIVAMTILFVVCWRLGPFKAEYPVVVVNYLSAIVLFGALYAMRRYIPDNRMISFMASISFPFYLIHAVFGFTIMKYLMQAQGLGYYSALICAIPILLIMAFLLHITIERRTIDIGRRLARRSFAPRRESADSLRSTFVMLPKGPEA